VHEAAGQRFFPRGLHHPAALSFFTARLLLSDFVGL
jgi:hypothetical protein